MSSSPNHLSLLKTPSKKRKSGPGDDLHALNEAKRRRSSLPYALLLRTELPPPAESSTIKADSRDRFLPTLTTTEPFYHINKTSPRSVRMARALGFVQPRLLSFHDDTPAPLLNYHLSDPTLPLRTHLAQSLAAATTNAPTLTHSAAKHGRMKPDRVLDSGPMDDFPPHPCAWSARDIIAAVIRGRVFTHDMDSNTVSGMTDYGQAECVEWTSSNELAVGHDWGGMVLVNTETTKMSRYLVPVISPSELCASTNVSHVNALSWSRERGLLAVGRANGAVSYYDLRQDRAVRNVPGVVVHSVLGVKWSPDGLFLASGHESGIVRCMDWRADRAFELTTPPQRKAAHKSAVKSLTWAPWNPHILATAGSTADHTVRIWSLSSSDAASPSPSSLSLASPPHHTFMHTLSLSSSITSLHFSPHTTELLSTHGVPVPNPTPSHPHLRSHTRRHRTGVSPTPLPTHHALLVHAYPSLQRMHTVLDAHTEPIVDSVLAPDGTRVMTFGEDETLRVWTVWGARGVMKRIGGGVGGGIR